MQGCADGTGDGCAGYDSYAFVAELYDWVVPYRERQDVAFFVEEAERAGGPVLEVGCGTGRVLIPSARAGVAMTGVDLSRRMLEVCRRRLADESTAVRDRVRLVEGDMREFELDQRFALITLPFRPFQHLIHVDDQLACLRTLRRHANDGARLILDVFEVRVDILAAPLSDDPIGTEPEFVMPDGRRVVRSHRVVFRDIPRQYFDGELIYDVRYPDGRQEQLVHAFRMRWFWRYELEHLLARSGWELEVIHAHYDRSERNEGEANEQICVARAV